MKKIKLEKLPIEKFLYESHIMNNSGLPYETAFGYRDSKEVPVLSKKNCMCVFMFNKEEGEFWVHLPYSLFEHYYETDEPLVEEEETIEDYGKQLDRIILEHQMQEIRQGFLASVKGPFARNLEAVSAEANKDGLMHFIWEPRNRGWWAYNLEESVRNPEQVKVVNDVGGFHYTDFTKATLEAGYKYATAISREALPIEEE